VIVPALIEGLTVLGGRTLTGAGPLACGDGQGLVGGAGRGVFGCGAVGAVGAVVWQEGDSGALMRTTYRSVASGRPRRHEPAAGGL